MLLPLRSAVVGLCFAGFSAVPSLATEPEPILANQNRVPAGVARGGVLRISLEARVGIWHPQADTGRGIIVEAFGEAGKALQIPGPLIRVRAGTSLEIKLRNTLTETLIIHGLHSHPGKETDTIHVAAGATRSVTIEAGRPGTYYYWGSTTNSSVELRDRDDSQLTGAFIVDPATGPLPNDRIFVLGLWFSPASRKGEPPRPEREVMVINGKSWPDTERHTFRVGDAVNWRWINATASSHPMHLHGFYFKVKSRGSWFDNTPVPAAQQRQLATDLLLPGVTIDMQWRAERAGNWVFHCHFAFHVSNQLYLAPRPDPAHAQHGGAHPMAGLVLGIHVLPQPTTVVAKASDEPRHLRLIAQQRTDTAFRRPAFGYALHSGGAEPNPDSLSIPGPMIVLRRGQPVAITVVNRLREPTAVHWHGIELESFPDGVPGWSGTPARIMPAIAPQDSFVAEFVPPRAGTFIYHSHSNELGQILGGLVGPLIVLDNADKLDVQKERVFLISAAGASFEESRFGLVNGQFEPAPMELDAHTSYRFRFINIGDWRVLFTLLDDRGFPTTRMIAKDGADLPEPVDGPMNMLSGPGETGDFLVNLAPGIYRLEFKQQISGWIIPIELKVRAR